MKGFLLLFAWAAGQSAMASPSEEPVIFRRVAHDGTIVFSDRPTGDAKGVRRADSVEVQVPEVNVVAPILSTLPAAPQLLPPAPPRHQAPPPVVVPQQHCEKLRQQLAELWRERRSGYSAERAVSLKKSIRQHQSEYKQTCGHWR